MTVDIVMLTILKWKKAEKYNSLYFILFKSYMQKSSEIGTFTSFLSY